MKWRFWVDPCTKFSEIKLENQQALTGLFFHDEVWFFFLYKSLALESEDQIVCVGTFETISDFRYLQVLIWFWMPYINIDIVIIG